MQITIHLVKTLWWSMPDIFLILKKCKNFITCKIIRKIATGNGNVPVHLSQSSYLFMKSSRTKFKVIFEKIQQA